MLIKKVTVSNLNDTTSGSIVDGLLANVDGVVNAPSIRAVNEGLAKCLPLTGGTLTGILTVPEIINNGNWVWSAPNNFYCVASGNNQEWSFDLGTDAAGNTQSYTGTHFQIWSKKHEKPIAVFYNDDMSVHFANGNLNVGGAVYANNGIVAYNPIHFANGVLNPVGDDVYIGDQNIAGTLAIKGANGNTALAFLPYSGSTTQTISTNGSGIMSITGNVSIGGMLSTGSDVGISGGLTVSGNISAGNTIFFPNTGANSGTWRGIYGTTGDNDDWVIRGSQWGSNSGYLEIATGDDGNESIIVRQYSGAMASAVTAGMSNVAREAYLLDSSGNTSFPGVVGAPTFRGYLDGYAYGVADGGAQTAVSGQGGIPGGITMVRAYSNGYPCTYGNVIRMNGGNGCGELLCEWTGSSWPSGSIFYRSRRDYLADGHTWTGWSRIVMSVDHSVFNLYMAPISTWNSGYSGYPGGTVMFCWE